MNFPATAPKRYGLFLAILPEKNSPELSTPFLPVPTHEWEGVLKRPLAFGAHCVGNVDPKKTDHGYADGGETIEKKEFVANTAVMVVKKVEYLEDLVRAAAAEGLYLCGLRTM